MCWMGCDASKQKSNQGNQDSCRNQKNVIQGQRPENRHTQQKTLNNQNNTYKPIKVNEKL